MKLKTLLALNLVAMFAGLAVVAGPPAFSAGKRLLTGADIQDSSLTGADVQNGSLSAADMDSSVGRPVSTYMVTADVTIPAGQYGTTTALCNDGNDQVLSGGFASNGVDSTKFEIVINRELVLKGASLGWQVAARNVTAADETLYVSARCLVVN